MNLHFVEDEKFIDHSYEMFEKYYPGENYFLVNKSFFKKLNRIKKRERIIKINFLSPFNLRKLVKIIGNYNGNEQVNFIVHYLTASKAIVISHLQKKIKGNIYWIFYGSDIYNDLEKMGFKELYDYPVPKKHSLIKRIKKKLLSSIFYLLYDKSILQAKLDFIQSLDYFCFWNHFDYKLIKETIALEADLKYYRYFAAKTPSFSLGKIIKAKKENSVLINHSSSITGNHLTVLDKLKKIDINNCLENLFVPLSYGNNMITDKVIGYGEKYFSNSFKPITEFLPKQDYFQLLRSVPSAIFGHRRQEAASTIFQLLASGAKVFLRKDNNLLLYLKEKGYRVFCFEDDLITYEDLFSMKFEDKLINHRLVQKELSDKEMDKTYKEFF